MVTMGVDASTSSSGWSIIIDDELIAHGRIKITNKEEDNWRKRCIYMGVELNKIMVEFKPNIIFLEDVPLMGFNKNPLTLVQLGHLQGIISILAHLNEVEIEYLQPTAWRSILEFFDGTQEGKKRDVLKKKAIFFVNETFKKTFVWKSLKSLANEDDECEAICINYSQVVKRRKEIIPKPSPTTKTGFGKRV